MRISKFGWLAALVALVAVVAALAFAPSADASMLTNNPALTSANIATDAAMANGLVITHTANTTADTARLDTTNRFTQDAIAAVRVVDLKGSKTYLTSATRPAVFGNIAVLNNSNAPSVGVDNTASAALTVPWATGVGDAATYPALATATLHDRDAAPRLGDPVMVNSDDNLMGAAVRWLLNVTTITTTAVLAILICGIIGGMGVLRRSPSNRWRQLA